MMKTFGVILAVSLSVMSVVLVIAFLPEIFRGILRLAKAFFLSFVFRVFGWGVLMVLLMAVSAAAALIILPTKQVDELLFLFFAASLAWLCAEGLSAVGRELWGIVNSASHQKD